MSNSSEHELLLACRRGHMQAVEPLVHMHIPAAVEMAERLTSQIPPDQLLEVVYDAFVTAFDEAIEGEADSLTLAFHGLVRVYIAREATAAAPWMAERPVPADLVRKLRADLVRELRVMIDIRAGAPHALTLAQRLLAELRTLRRRIRLRTDLLRSRQPTITVHRGEPE